MARRRSRPGNQQHRSGIMGYIRAYRPLLLKLVWGLIGLVCVLYGFSNGYPLVVQGKVLEGILIGLAYGVGAFILIFAAFIINRRLKGS